MRVEEIKVTTVNKVISTINAPVKITGDGVGWAKIFGEKRFVMKTQNGWVANINS